ncbi:MAG: selenium metabolism-associated LysR family transcriptional regulator [Bacillota bacterium]
MSELNFYQLKAFYMVAKHLNFSRAAEEMSLSQPAVSRQVAALEKNLGLELFVQRGRRVELTDAGRSLFDYADRIFELAEQAERAVSQFKDLERGKVLIGASKTVGSYILPPLLRAFQERYPNIDITLRMGNSEEVEQLVDEKDIDIGFIGGQAKNISIHSEPYLKDELVVIISPEHYLNSKKDVSVKDITGLPLIWREKGSITRSLMEDFFNNNKIEFEKKIEIGCTEAIKRLVAAGVGIAFVSRSSISLELSAGILRVIDSNELQIPMYFSVILTKDQHYYPTMLSFLNFIRKWSLE